jgi:hypothetical protein
MGFLETELPEVPILGNPPSPGPLFLSPQFPRMEALGNLVNRGEDGLAAYNHRRTEDL